MLKRLIAVLLLAVAIVVPSMALSEPSDTLPRAATRYFQIGETSSCSAVVIQPNYATTAKHCITDKSDQLPYDPAKIDLIIDGKRVESITLHQNPEMDMAVVYVPGLKCPCVPLLPKDMKRYERGTNLLITGYPFGSQFEPKLLVSKEGRFLGSVVFKERDFFTGVTTNYPLGMIDTLAAGGMSGGGVFYRVNGEYYLVGVVVAGIGPFLGMTELEFVDVYEVIFFNYDNNA